MFINTTGSAIQFYELKYIKNLFYRKIMMFKIALLLIVIANSFEVKSQIFNVRTFGAKADGLTDDRLSIKKTIDSAHLWSLSHLNKQAIVYFPASEKCYLISSITKIYSINADQESRLRNYIFYTHSNIKFQGDTNTVAGSVLKFKDHMFDKIENTKGNLDNGTGIYTNANLFYGKNESNISFDNLIIDFNGLKNLLPNGQNDNSGKSNFSGQIKTIYGIVMDGGSNLMIDRVKMKNNPGRNDIFINAPGSNLTIQNCNFKNGGRNVGSDKVQNTNSYDFSFVYSEWDNSIFANDSIIQQYPEITLQESSNSGGIEIHGSNSTMYNNYIFSCKPAVYISSSNGLSQDFTMDNKSLQNILIKKNKLIDCYRGIFFWSKNYINDVIIDSNTITTMLAKKTNLFVQNIGSFADIAGIYCPRGNLPCDSDYKYKTGGLNLNLGSLNNIQITNNVISFDLNSEVPTSTYLTNVFFETTAIVIHSMQNSIIANNTIKNMNWSGLSLQGSPMGMNNITITGNTISDFQYSYNSNVASYIIITDTYLPNSNCNRTHKQTYKNIRITGNTLISNSVVIKESMCSEKGISCFKGIFFSLPGWYAYHSVKPYILNKNAFILSNNIYSNYGALSNTEYFVESICPPSSPCYSK